jgi:hypothetical protein
MIFYILYKNDADECRRRSWLRRNRLILIQSGAMIFLEEQSIVVCAVIILGVSGGFIAALFQNRRFVLLLSPVCGLLTLPPLVTLIYSTDRVSLFTSAVTAIVILSCLTLLNALRLRSTRSDVLISGALLLVISAVATAMFCAATISTSIPSILYIDGSDHGGYAHAADWLLSHKIGQQPVLSPKVPYDSWPVVMFTGDVRYSAFVSVALVALLNGTSGLFAYDLTCAIAFTVACLSVAAVFSSSVFVLLALSAGLLTSLWFDQGRDGFLGKLLAYPSCLFLIGLFLTSHRGMSLRQMAALAALTVGVATLHSGLITAFFFGVTSVIFIFAEALTVKSTDEFLIDRFIPIAAITFISLASVGMFARPASVPITPPGYFIEWATLLPHLFDVQNIARNYHTVSGGTLLVATAAALIAQALLISMAVVRRNAVALALALAPPTIFLAMMVVDSLGSQTARYAAYQFAGIAGSFGLCAAACLFDDAKFADIKPNRARLWIGAAIAMTYLLLIVARVPRALNSLATYVFDPPAAQIFKQSDFAAFAAAANGKPVLVDTRDDLNTIAALVELSRLGIDLQWTPAAWKVIVGYRPWAAPTYEISPATILEDKRGKGDPERLIYESGQLRLSRLPL